MEKWYEYLYYTENSAVNIERVDKVSGITGHETLDYTLRTLDVLESIGRELLEEEYLLIKTVLQWSEVAKGGTVKDRADWADKNYPLDIHNIASAEIYKDYTSEEGAAIYSNEVYILIRTHGMIGQCLRGEVPVSGNAELGILLENRSRESVTRILYILNECIITAVSADLWNRVKAAVYELIDRLMDGDFRELPGCVRVRNLLPGLSEVPEELIRIFEEDYFPGFELWYFEAALSDFSGEQLIKILKDLSSEIRENYDSDSISYISFKPLADSLYYDYEGRKHINIYKKRIIEKYLRDSSTENVSLNTSLLGGALLVDFKFSRVCEKLIDFCVEAERCGLLTFEKSITVLYDMFGFRRDEFDRLNNEAKYLATMNSSEKSTKNTIIEYVVGNRVVDVGSGGGVLLDLLEKRFPDKTIIGTDISENVIEVLNKKRIDEKHKWEVLRHNFADNSFVDAGHEKVDTVIFSSIMHEIYSYTETPQGRFNIEIVRKALRYAYDSLNPGGRLVIRDGVKTPIPMKDGKIDIKADTLRVTFKERSGLDFFRNYLQDFKGLPDIEDRRIEIDEAELSVSGCVNYMREFLYTFTWGSESYSHEVQEQFGYFTVDEYREFLEGLGAVIIRADAFLEPGYPEHLRELVTLEPDIFPDSNCIIIAEKPL